MDQDYSEVFIPFSDYHCGGCGESLQKAIVFIFRDDGKPICLKCADLDSPVFLPDDGATIEQTVCQDSTLGIFFIGADERKFRRKKRKAFPVTVVDLKNQAHKQQFAKHIRDLYPGCPAGEKDKIIEHFCEEHSGRVGCSTTDKCLYQAVKLAVTAYIRHNMTDYDDLLDQGIDRDEARKMVIYRTNEILSEWESDDGDDPA